MNNCVRVCQNIFTNLEEVEEEAVIYAPLCCVMLEMAALAFQNTAIRIQLSTSFSHLQLFTRQNLQRAETIMLKQLNIENGGVVVVVVCLSFGLCRSYTVPSGDSPIQFWNYMYMQQAYIIAFLDVWMVRQGMVIRKQSIWNCFLCI